jgi:hypothetical protein
VTSAQRLAAISRAAVLDAARAYAEATEEPGGQRLEPLVLGARMRLAAKAMLAAERAADESRRSPPVAPPAPIVGVRPIEHGDVSAPDGGG